MANSIFSPIPSAGSNAGSSYDISDFIKSIENSTASSKKMMEAQTNATNEVAAAQINATASASSANSAVSAAQVAAEMKKKGFDDCKKLLT